ncbi:hypothetical protein [uncultured Clostridium sp.]|nr:hypothetical protein [uncultured Clostridium sp.]
MRENSGKESKAIKVLFQKLIDDNYKQKEYRGILHAYDKDDGATRF